MTPPKSQLNLPPTLLPKDSEGPAARASDSRASAGRTKRSLDGVDADAALIFDEALRSARDLRGKVAPITSQEISHLLGVSESLVNRWRSPHYRESPSWTQMLRLPVSFHWALLKTLSRRFGFRQLALRQLLDAVGDVAVAGE
jgi:hypothetical protein